ncbi:diguanylate cyclase [Streptomyces abyssalis]|uniref:Diguanylate cyclase n=1 Tax=Streptomyces abyssalis TaxID=933944 RepID=A0A1E7JNG5_9ACTN|nr:PAS domain-containing protein [Streptomyces abyssalis]OEU86794.1 diguanylate cyclase [Streptomyces abyssalis]OEU89819.1 diguanylate cyclase [Streptomyces abyssalis]
MSARSRTHAASSSDGDDRQGPDDELLLAALLDGMDAALCAFDADGAVTHWNREAERLLGWTQEEAVGRKGLAGWALREADAEQVQARLFSAMDTPGRQVHEFALLTKDGRRLLVRTQASGVVAADGSPMGVYCAFSEVHAQIDLERSIALSECLFEDATWGVVLVDADLRPAVVNVSAASAFRVSRAAMLGRPLGELVDQGVEELEGALQHVLADGPPSAPAEIWVTLRSGRRGPGPGEAAGAGPQGAGQGEAYGARRCWRSGFLRLSSPMAEAPVPLGVAWLFQDVTDSKRMEQEADRLRFRDNQLHRAARAAAECEKPMEAATVHLDFALAGFADHALLDLALPAGDGERGDSHGLDAFDADGQGSEPGLVRVAATPASGPDPVPSLQRHMAAGQAGQGAFGGIPVSYAEGHPAHQAYARCGSVRASVGGVAAAGSAGGAVIEGWAAARKWPDGTVHGLCTVLRSRGRTLGVVTFLRGASRRSFDRSDAAYAEDIAVRIAAAVDMAQLTQAPRGPGGAGH